ncbi:GFA family protein [Chania multitudinisentens]|uniref:GFA family protein n=1 Tax=Chania multitudinisentens TaxID=1639108 RepID=UPI00090066E6|nr:GFA family protein [Chania multitudinisentens]
MKIKEYHGGCLCGHIRFVAHGEAHHPHTCSCTLCQRHSGSLTLCWVEFPKDQVQWTGPGGTPSLYRSSAASCRAFCSICGSTLGAIDDAPTLGLLLGAFDKKNQKSMVPEFHSFRASRPRWWKIAIANGSKE